MAERSRKKLLSVPELGALIARKSELIAEKLPEAWLLKQEVVLGAFIPKGWEGTQEVCL